MIFLSFALYTCPNYTYETILVFWVRFFSVQIKSLQISKKSSITLMCTVQSIIQTHTKTLNSSRQQMAHIKGCKTRTFVIYTHTDEVTRTFQKTKQIL